LLLNVLTKGTLILRKPKITDKNTKYVLFMDINEFSDDEKHEYLDEEGEVNLKGELIYALSELKNLRKKKRLSQRTN
jgi:hypothetical protein